MHRARQTKGTDEFRPSLTRPEQPRRSTAAAPVALAVTALRRGWAADLLRFWFGELGQEDWFGGSAALDKALRERFGRWHAMLRGQRVESFGDSPREALAAVLLFDQVPRNVFRDDPRAFATDPLALAITHVALRRGWGSGLTFAERQFFYMPLMHSEAIADQRLSLRLFGRLPRRYGWQFARAHHQMIARFGRFPHRNAVLGRESSVAEVRAVEAGNNW